MKYFFLTEGWTVGRVWGVEGLWNAIAWRREPAIERINLSIVEHEEILWLYRVEDAVIMVEVKPKVPDASGASSIGQVFLRRLMSAEQVIERLAASEAICQMNSSKGTKFT
ncbi:hypothetical protein [Phormidium sp. CCY1219]|uniref:hypothetical protein n=1 Tax=Phormidium sp. CCY1219 TaxID=2886104 RepID=UPI002D1E5A02|nr:hypothetical protein [Phormidium sp. CCY1219]MEB3831091.1 hypothetical protein [Phormidium sp. CCY1219]